MNMDLIDNLISSLSLVDIARAALECIVESMKTVNVEFADDIVASPSVSCSASGATQSFAYTSDHASSMNMLFWFTMILAYCGRAILRLRNYETHPVDWQSSFEIVAWLR